MSTALQAETNLGSNDRTHAVNRVRNSFIACRVKFKWFGTSKSLTSNQRIKVAESFGADGAAISAGKRLIDTKHEGYRSIMSIKS